MKILNEDCMDVMERRPDNYFDLAIVDPPYGIGDSWSKRRTDRFFKKGKLHEYQNKQIPSKEYFNELFRVSKNQIIWGGNYFTEYLAPTNHWLIWNKCRSFEKTFMSECELAWHSFSSPCRFVTFPWNGAIKGKETGIKKIHPHQKPIALYKWLLEKYAKPNHKILDTHLGSGSHAIAWHYFQKDGEFVGCELDEFYYKECVKRVTDSTRQLVFF